ncbi:hypothetical protein LJ656_11155 [Paraburkholderia sp. MMS20-SJTR3]|uniref:Uncharacterized protein n=1 Tax=Paraburkholderia sejongensis TaxID=2886946 RepID=A0ABS8JTB6_9BURK|nr:hypothetical protein [Paraburkholderia sp. MMS20-SJTR3]MCC8393149.1 hypothetical protein [Paraburkholderia sp. MMS20-SJTR3]
MKRALICLTLALLMSLPVGYGISRLPGVWEWIYSADGYSFFKPLFRAFDTYGNEGNLDVIIGTLTVAGFFVSLVSVNAAWTIIMRLRHRRYRETR